MGIDYIFYWLICDLFYFLFTCSAYSYELPVSIKITLFFVIIKAVFEISPPFLTEKYSSFP